MSKSKLCWLVILIVTLCSLTLGPPAQVQAKSPEPPEPVDVLVTFYQPPGPDETALIESHGGTVGGVYHIVPTVAATIPSDKLDEVEADPAVELVELDAAVPGYLGGEMLLGEVLPQVVGQVGAELVHPSHKGTGVKVAILDTGIDLDHPDLAVAGDVTFVYGTTSGDDDHGHGTLIAGIVAALDNDIGAIGVAPEVSLYAVKVLDYKARGKMGDILSGIEWSVDNDMQVINMSFGSLLGMKSSIRKALANAYNAGTVIVADAGNSGNASGTGENIWAPARFQPVIAVGATDQQGARRADSSTGCTLELMTPGDSIYSTAMGGGYGYLSNTLVSSPLTAGVAALLIASGVSGGAEVRYRLRSSAEDLGAPGWDTQYGWGVINADLAINFTEPADRIAPTTTVSLNGTGGDNGWYLSDVEVTLTATDNEGGSGVVKTEYSRGDNYAPTLGKNWYLYTGPFTITFEGTTNILAKSWDNAANDESPMVSQAVNIDRIAPTTAISLSGTMGDNGWYVSDVEVTLTVTDDEYGSGGGGSEYSLDGGETWNTYTSPFAVTADGNNVVLARSWDIAGNVESLPVSETFNIDQTPPTLTETPLPAQIGKLGKGVMVEVNYTGTVEDPVSGVYGLPNTVLIDEYGVCDQDLGSELSGVVSVEAWCLGSDKDGRSYTFRLTARDSAGNVGSIDGVAIVLHDGRVEDAAGARYK